MNEAFATLCRAGTRQVGLSAGTSATIAEVLASSGCDWLFIDSEYTPTTSPALQEMVRAAELAGCPPLVRMNTDHPADIRQVLDMGSAGVIMPQVRSSEQARQLVAAAKYPPLGQRGLAVARAQGFEPVDTEYLASANRSTMLIAMIEDVDALDNIDAIAAVPGLDGLFVGGGDLSMSLGCLGQPLHEKMKAAVEHIALAGRTRGLVLGALAASREQLCFYDGHGFRLLLAGLESQLLLGAARRRLAEVRDWLGGAHEPTRPRA